MDVCSLTVVPSSRVKRMKRFSVLSTATRPTQKAGSYLFPRIGSKIPKNRSWMATKLSMDWLALRESRSSL